jgi:hypothetical protein
MKIILLLVVTVPLNLAFAVECKFLSNPNVISQTDHELHQFWIEENIDVFRSQKKPNTASLLKYLSTVASKFTDTNPYSLLEKTYNEFIKTGVRELMLEAPNMSLVLSKKTGMLHSTNCLESLLLSQQTERGLSWDNPMEFSAFILKKSERSRSSLKIYYSTNDRPGGKINTQITDLIQADLVDGWLLLNHLHNHTFNTPVSNGINLVGAPSPSLSDVDLYRQLKIRMGLKSASVTNGFDTLDIESSEFSVFNAH